MGEICAEILLAAYNGERYIREQIDSILTQEDKRWHLTVSDDGSAIIARCGINSIIVPSRKKAVHFIKDTPYPRVFFFHTL